MMRDSRTGWRLISAVVLTVGLSAAAAGPVGGASVLQEATLAKYLSSASWPVRASSMRVHTVADRINLWLAHGDPPYLGEIAAACSNVLALNSDRRGNLAKLTAPAPLQAAHVRLSRAHSKVEAGCTKARAIAVRARDAADSLAGERARQYFHQFAPTLRSFSQTVARWRSAVLAYASTLRVSPPAWLRQLR